MYYILKIDAFHGDDTSLSITQDNSDPDNDIYSVDDLDSIFAIVMVDETGAHILDNGYRSIAEAKDAWPKAIEPQIEPK